MYRSTIRVALDNNKQRVVNRIEGNDVVKGSAEFEHARYQMLVAIANDPSLLHCGDSHFETLKMFHNGQRWIVETEVLIERS
jgi:hypothetical protein